MSYAVRSAAMVHGLSLLACFRRSHPRVLGLLVALAVVGAGRAAAATPSLTITKILPKRVDRNGNMINLRPTALQPTWISYADCIADLVIQFPVSIIDPQGTLPPEVWATTSGAQCTDPSVRQNTATGCWRIDVSGPTVAGGGTIDVPVRDIVIRNPSFGTISHGSIDDCQGNSTAAQPITLYFMLTTGPGSPAVASDSVSDIKFDLEGPTAPTDVKAKVGDTLLKVDWTISPDMDLTSYLVYCDPAGSFSKSELDRRAVPAPGGSAPSGSAPSGGATATSACPDASTPGTSIDAGSSSSDVDAAGDDGATGDDGAAAAASGSTTSAGGGAGCPTPPASATCVSNVLIPGMIPTTDLNSHFCGAADGLTATEALIEGLTNYKQYAIAVAGVDDVGNIGPLSELGCQTPKEISDFSNEVARDGGPPPNGLCAVRAAGAAGPRGQTTRALSSVTVLAGVWLLRRFGFRHRKRGARRARRGLTVSPSRSQSG